MTEEQVGARQEQELHSIDNAAILVAGFAIIAVIATAAYAAIVKDVKLNFFSVSAGMLTLIGCMLGYVIIRRGESRGGDFSAAEAAGSVLIFLGALMFGALLLGTHRRDPQWGALLVEEPPPPIISVSESPSETLIKIKKRAAESKKFFVLLEYEGPPSDGVVLPPKVGGKVWYISKEGATSRAAEF